MGRKKTPKSGAGSRGKPKGSEGSLYGLSLINGVLALVTIATAAYFVPGSTSAPSSGSPSLPPSELYQPWIRDSDVPETWHTGSASADTAWLSSADAQHDSDALRDCAPANFLSDGVRSPGFHMLCVLPVEAEASNTATPGALARIAVFKHGLLTERAVSTFLVPAALYDADIPTLVDFFSFKLQLKPRRSSGSDDWRLIQRMGLFSSFGTRLTGAADALKRHAILGFEGGQWLWPAVKVGHTVALGELRKPGEMTYIRTLSLQPRVLEVQNFLSDAEADGIQEAAAPHVSMSGVSVKDVDRGKDVTTWRTSATHFLSSRRHRPLLDIEQRVQRVTRVNISHSEDTQVLHYQKKGRYLAHNDFFDPKDYAGDPNTMAMIEAGARNRLATVFFYLNDVEEGGHTTFPRAGDLPIPVDQHGQADYANCEQGIQVKPEKNKVIIFYSLHPDGTMDHNSLHGACPVKRGNKWSANFWLWNKAFRAAEVHPAKMQIAQLPATTAFDDAIITGDARRG